MININCPQLFPIVGLILNTIASIILMWPYIVGKHFVDEDLITDMNMNSGKFHKKKHLRERKNNLLGLGFMSIGFIFQLLGLFTN